MSIYLICPVRNSTQEVQAKIEAYVESLEQEGQTVYWPARDTNQNDPTGLTISKTNAQAILEAREIHIWYDPKSLGSIFDLGISFPYITQRKKRFFLINKEELSTLEGKHFQNIILNLEKELQSIHSTP